MTSERPDGEFIGELCGHCGRPIGREWGGPVVGLANKEWLHLDCMEERWKCPHTGKNCFNKPNGMTACATCMVSMPSEENDIGEFIWKAAQEDVA